MSKSVNKVILIGNLGKDPELKHTSGGTAVAELALATSSNFKDKEGKWQERTEWHRIVLWERLAEVAEKYLKKGRSVYIEGRLQTRSWEDKQGQKRYTTEVVASELVLLGGGRGGEDGGSGGKSSSRGSDFDQSGSSEFESTPTRSTTEITDDDIPF
jgi:single-strand DNA-binding protein